VFGASKFARWLAFLLVFVSIVSCSGDSPTDASKQSDPPAVSRLWQFWVADRNHNWTLLRTDLRQDEGVVDDQVELGDVAIKPRGRRDDAYARVFSNETADSYSAEATAPHLALNSASSTGAVADLYQEWWFVVDSDTPSLAYTLSRVFLQMIDGDAGIPDGCQVIVDPRSCRLIAARASFRLSASTPAGLDDLLSTQGTASLQGLVEIWDPDVRTEDGDRPAFAQNQFELGIDDLGHQVSYNLIAPITYRIPTEGLKRGDTVIVNVKVSAQAVDARQAETYASAFLRDPLQQSGGDGGLTVEATGLHLVKPPHVPSVEEMEHAPHSAPPCAGAHGNAGTLQFSAPQFTTSEGEFPGARVTITRTGGSDGLVSAVVTTGSGTATSGVDYEPVTAVVRFGNGESGSRTVTVPIHGDATIEPDETIGLTLSQVGGCATLGGQTTATLTIEDDDDQSPPPAQFSIGGTVSGLVGSGLLLRDRISGFEVRPTTNGSFTIVPAQLDGSNYAVEVATQPSNPLQVCTVASGTGTLSGANITNIAVTCAPPASTGSLDANFGSAGRVTAVMAGGATAIALQADGRIVAVGGSKVERFNADGTADQNFGTGGQADFVFANATENFAQGVAIAPDGTIVVVGYARSLSRDDFAVARYTSNGALDASFASAGHLIVDFGAASARGAGIAIQSDGAIVVAGQATLSRSPFFDTDFAAARLTTTGALDPTFGTGGKTTINIAGATDFATAVAIHSDGKIVLTGHAAVDGGSNGNVGIVRLTSTGAPDGTFGTSGIVNTNLGLGDVTREAFDLAIQSDGKVVITGEVQVQGVFNVLVARFTTSGALDATFGTNGMTTTAFTTNGDAGNAIALQSDGKIVVAGRTALFGTSDFALARYASNGLLDSTFGNAGKVTVDFLSGNDAALGVVVQPDGRIVAAGFARNGNSIGLGMVRVVP